MVDFSKFNSPEYRAEFERRKAEQEKQEEIEEQLRLKTCCFTGHRPDKLAGGYNWYHPENIELGNVIKTQVVELIENYGVYRFICGGALGVDQMAFAICHKLKKTYPNLHLILAIPFKNQDCVWKNKTDLQRYVQQKQQADEIIYVDELCDLRYKIDADVPKGDYHPHKMSRRNEYMVDHSQYIIAIWDGSKGGTGNCVRYAKQAIGYQRMIIRINPRRNYEVEISYS
ncbi:MAG TPA: DUF1273 family protein [Gallicola sp.]|nr:DUF1273 family protein [Gallicola sp.]